MPDTTDVKQQRGDDVSSLRRQIDQLGAELVQSRQGIHAFVGMLAHDLRTPLGAILMWTHVLRMGRENDREAALDAIEASAHEQSAMIASLLDLARALAGVLRLNMTSVDLGKTASLALEDARSAATTAQVQLTVTIAADALPVRGDAARLREMVAAMVNDSVDRTPPQGQIAATVGRLDRVVRITVSDSGPGLLPEEADAIFTPFKLTARRDRRRPGDLGLALPLVRQVAQLHGGSARAENREAGYGRSLIVELPLEHRTESA